MSISNYSSSNSKLLYNSNSRDIGSGRSSNSTIGLSESRLRPEEKLYHTILVKNISITSSNSISNNNNNNINSLAFEYAEASESRRQELLTEALSSEVENAMDRSKGGRSDNLHRESLESRAERD